MNLNKKNISPIQLGFSLIELLVVVAIIGILAGIGIVAYDSYVEYTRRSVNEANAKLLANLLSAELSAQKGKLKSNCAQTLGRIESSMSAGPWSNCINTLVRNNSMINPYSNELYGNRPADSYGLGIWSFREIIGFDEASISSGACSDDVGGIAMVFLPSEDNKNKGFVATCKVLKNTYVNFTGQEQTDFESVGTKFFAIGQ
jgi:type IV pilus assembly protein PilA